MIEQWELNRFRNIRFLNQASRQSALAPRDLSEVKSKGFGRRDAVSSDCVRKPKTALSVILSEAKNLGRLRCKLEILRLAPQNDMTPSPLRGEEPRKLPRGVSMHRYKNQKH